MSKHRDQFFFRALVATAFLMALLVISYFTRGIPTASVAITIAIIVFEITVPFEILKRLDIQPRDCHIYAHDIDTTLDLLFPPFGRLRNKPDFHGLWREFLSFVVITTLIFVPYVLCYWAYFEMSAVKTKAELIISWNFPPALLYEIVTQIFVIALPEELYYRGFLQHAFVRKMSSRSRFNIGLAVVLTNLIFAFGHVASTFNPSRMLTFFPGLIFSYLVLRHKSLFSAILFHAACNILGQILYASFYLR